MEEELLKLAVELEAPLRRYLKWKAVVNRYERGRDTKIGEIRAMIKKDKKSQDDIKYEVKAHPEYIKYLSEWNAAERGMFEEQITVDTLRCKFDAIQSALAFKRESIKREIL